MLEATDQTIQIYGGMGLMDDLPLERFWRDARVERIYDGTRKYKGTLFQEIYLAIGRVEKEIVNDR